LLFGFGGVLYDDTVWRRWLLRLLSHLGLHTHYRSFYHVWDRDFAADVYRGQTPFCDAFTAFLRSAGLSRGQIDEVMAACQGRRRELDESTRPLPGVRCTLGRLCKTRLVLGVLSDCEWTSDQLRSRLAAFAPPQAFAAVVSSYDIGYTKPAQRCYTTAAEQMGLAPTDIAFVGHDSEELDGARAVGMANIAFNSNPDAEADVCLDRFDQLVDVISIRPTMAAAG
jgi:FMN phosphatase YigB (HAD superfamily)